DSIARGEKFKKFLATLDVAVIGPNCMGSVGVRQRLYMYPHTHVAKLDPGPVALVTQSGGTLSYVVKSFTERGLKFSYAISSGNELDLDLADYVNFLVDDEGTRQIILFIEGIRDPAAFMLAAGRALAAGKPLIAIKTGRSQKSRDAAQSHSGAVAGDYAAFLAMCERYGIITVESLEDMLEVTLAFQQGRLPKGPAIAFMTTSGGTVDLLHDYTDAEGAVVPELGPETVEAIRPHLPPDTPIRNPIDTGAPVGASGRSAPVEICKAFARDPGVDIVGWCINMPGTARATGADEPVKELLAATDKPVIAFARMAHQVNPDGLAAQADTNLWYLQGLLPAVRAMNALWFFAERAARSLPALPVAGGNQADCSGAALEAALGRVGLCAPATARAGDAAEAAEAAAKVGFPVALKIVSPQASHKTEVGGVSLGLMDAAAVEAAAASMAERLKAVNPSAVIEGYLAQEMVSGVEILVGARDDPLYGPMIVLGAGGVMVELVRDVAIRLLPVTKGDVRAMLKELRVTDLLQGFRGGAACDVHALVDAVVALGDFYLDHREWLADIEINPLMVGPAGKGVRAVDIRAVPRAG
ncbi:MAG: acetate--CoA ligase family protein, partial [Alphaproteobacteria bacterium]